MMDPNKYMMEGMVVWLLSIDGSKQEMLWYQASKVDTGFKRGGRKKYQREFSDIGLPYIGGKNMCMDNQN